MSDTIRFDGRVAIVTGAGGGLGKDYALALARRGAKVVVNDLGGSAAGEGASTSPAAQVVEQIRDEGGTAVASFASAATREGGSAIVQAALDAWGRVDICIANAGFLRNNRFEDITDDQLDAIIDVHLKGAFYVGQPAYKAMRANGYGRFVFTGSASGMFGHAWQANYAAGKAGLLGLSNVVALEGSAYGIKSNLLLPTAETRMGDVMSEGYLEIPEFARSVQTADFSASAGRFGRPFTTPLVLYLVSEQCQHTHGVFSANSGRFAQVHIAAAEGWYAPPGDTPPMPEDVATHFDRICDMTHYHEPMTVYDEFAAVATAAKRQYG